MDFFYLSQVLGRPVFTNRGERVARIKDLVARLEALNAKGEVTLEAYPPLSGLVVVIAKRQIFIPWTQVKTLDSEGAHLSSARIDLRHFTRREGEVLLNRDMLDKQLIDIDGRRVIRANDLQLYRSDGSVRLTAVDVSSRALLRRLTFGRMFDTATIGSRAPVPRHGPYPEEPRGLRRRRVAPAGFIKWPDVEPLKAGVPDVRLRLSHERLNQLHPVDIAHIADELSYLQGAEIIESLDVETAAEVLGEMDDDESRADIVEGMDQELVADILEEMDPGDAADLLADLDEVQAEDLKRRMDQEEVEDVNMLLAYPEDSAGGLMTTDYLTAPGRLTVDQTITLMRRLDDAPNVIDYLYVVEEDEPVEDWLERSQEGGGKLIGIVSLRDILLSSADRTLVEMMDTDFNWVRADDSAEEAARTMADYNLLALPVLDEGDLLVGIITVDDAMELLLPEKLLRRLPRIFG
jgi:CBS domain-containing protein/sporulation protein YlmC with PRC-barrel domain